jgi:hypothetical protein
MIIQRSDPVQAVGADLILCRDKAFVFIMAPRQDQLDKFPSSYLAYIWDPLGVGRGSFLDRHKYIPFLFHFDTYSRRIQWIFSFISSDLYGQNWTPIILFIIYSPPYQTAFGTQ